MRVWTTTAILGLGLSLACKCPTGDDPTPPRENYLRVINLIQGSGPVDLYLPDSKEAVVGLQQIAFPSKPTPERYLTEDAVFVPSCTEVSSTGSGTDDYRPPHCYVGINVPLDRPRIIESGNPGVVLAELANLEFYVQVVAGQGGIEWQKQVVTTDGTLNLQFLGGSDTCETYLEENPGSTCNRYFTLVLYRTPPATATPNDATIQGLKIEGLLYEDVPKTTALDVGRYALRTVNRAPFFTTRGSDTLPGVIMASVAAQNDAVPGDIKIGSENLLRDTLWGMPPDAVTPATCKSGELVTGAEAYCSVSVASQPGGIRQYVCAEWEPPVASSEETNYNWWTSLIRDGVFSHPDPTAEDLICPNDDEGLTGDVINTNTLVLTDITLEEGKYYTMFLGGGQRYPGRTDDEHQKQALRAIVVQDADSIDFISQF